MSASCAARLAEDAGRPVVSSGTLDGKPPTLPRGVFVYTAKAGEDRVTWQPRSGVRQAVVVRRIAGSIAAALVLVRPEPS